MKQLIEKLGNHSIAYEFENGQNFLDSLPFQEKKPDLFILDYSMPLLNGIEVLQQLEKRQDEEYKVLLLTQHLEEDIIDKAYQHGARGFLHKNCSAAELKFCIDNILSIGYSNITEILKRIKNYKNQEENRLQNIKLSDREQHFHSDLIFLAIVKCWLTDAVFTANLIHCFTLILFRQYLDDLNF